MHIDPQFFFGLFVMPGQGDRCGEGRVTGMQGGWKEGLRCVGKGERSVWKDGGGYGRCDKFVWIDRVTGRSLSYLGVVNKG